MKGEKLKRFQEIKAMPHVLEYPTRSAGNWSTIFDNNNSIILELACGRGEYTIELAQRNPNQNFIGVDIKGNRLWSGAKRATDLGLNNVRFLRIQIDQINRYFIQDEVNEIWIVYPDPFIKFSKQRKRLTHPKFLRLYQEIMISDSIMHLKTDSPSLYKFTNIVLKLSKMKILNSYDNTYNVTEISSLIRIPTYYENLDIAKSKKVFYIKWELSGVDIPLYIDKMLKEQQHL